MKRFPGTATPRQLWSTLAPKLSGRSLAFFFDYDGTLAEITTDRAGALLSERRAALLSEIARTHPTTILTGRSRCDVEKLVGIAEINYAGTHGFDIVLARSREKFIADETVRPEIKAAAELLRARVKALAGVEVEDKEYAIAVHYRRAPEHEAALATLVNAALECFPALRRARGRKVFELRPAVDWDKGRALWWIMERLSLLDSVPVFIGDDESDEDAFRALAGRGIGIAVGERSSPTEATYGLNSVNDVYRFLAFFPRGQG